MVPLKSSWVMTCAIEKTTDSVVASGGLDNVCTLHSVSAGAVSAARPLMELQGHDGYLSCCRFVDARTILTSSGDSTCISWDVEKGEDVSHFTDHGGDVMCLSVHPTNPSVFVSGSVDATAKVWDTRTGACVQTFVGHESDVNAVQFTPCGTGFATGSDDSSAKLFDLRAYARVNEMVNENAACGVTSVDFSASGRLLFTGLDDCNAYGWDVLAENVPAPVYTLAGHSNRVSALAMNSAGQALATGSWDFEVCVWG